MPSPEVLNDLLVQGALIRNKFRVEESHAFECILMEDPLAETMNSVDRRLVEIPQRRPQNAQYLTFVIPSICNSGLDPESM